MKLGWDIRKLGDICHFENGDRGTNYPSKSHRANIGIPFINAGHLNSSGLIMEKMDYITRERFNLLGSGKIKSGDILFCLRGSLGKFACVEGLTEGAIASSLVIVRPNELVSRAFLMAYFESKICADMIAKYSNGAAQPNLSAGNLRNFQIPLPPRPEQESIVAILDETLATISKVKANAEQNLTNANELFESYLQSLFTKKGDGWEEKSLGEIATVKGGKRVPKGYRLQTEPTNYPYIRVTDFNDNGSIDMNDLHYVSEDIFNQIKNYTISSKDLYISIAGTIGKTGIVPKELEGANLTENACKLVFKEGIDPKLIYYFTKSGDFLKQAGINTRIAAMPKLALIRLSTIHFSIPKSIRQQQAIVQKLDALSAETKKLEAIIYQKLSYLEELKKSILQKAFSGELN